jgi:hypothetical protein
MVFADQFLDFMPHQVGVEPFASRDAWGNKSYGTLVTYWGRVVNKRRKIIDRMGSEVISETTIYLVTDSGISVDDRITLPSGLLPAHPLIITVTRTPDENGDFMTTLYA